MEKTIHELFQVRIFPADGAALNDTEMANVKVVTEADMARTADHQHQLCVRRRVHRAVVRVPGTRQGDLFHVHLLCPTAGRACSGGISALAVRQCERGLVVVPDRGDRLNRGQPASFPPRI